MTVNPERIAQRISLFMIFFFAPSAALNPLGGRMPKRSGPTVHPLGQFHYGESLEGTVSLDPGITQSLPFAPEVALSLKTGETIFRLWMLAYL